MKNLFFSRRATGVVRWGRKILCGTLLCCSFYSMQADEVHYTQLQNGYRFRCADGLMRVDFVAPDIKRRIS